MVSFLDEKGRPGIVKRAYIYPPTSQIGPISPEQQQSIIKTSAVYAQYEREKDRESAYEKLKSRITTQIESIQPKGKGMLGESPDTLGLPTHQEAKAAAGKAS